MDVFALTSRSEGMPLSVLEAWVAELPVVASRVGGLPEIVAAGRNGFLFESGDEMGLAGALAEVLGDPGRARAMGEAGSALVRERFSLPAMAAEYGRHYREARAHGRGARG
jgi:glycosyltransferase involved in cell wall biosynthesis